MLLLFPVVGSGLSSVDTGFGDRTWLLDWILGFSLGHVEREEGCRPSRQRAEWLTDGKGRMCEDQISLKECKGSGRVGYMHQNKPLADQT